MAWTIATRRASALLDISRIPKPPRSPGRVDCVSSSLASGVRTKLCQVSTHLPATRSTGRPSHPGPTCGLETSSAGATPHSQRVSQLLAQSLKLHPSLLRTWQHLLFAQKGSELDSVPSVPLNLLLTVRTVIRSGEEFLCAAFAMVVSSLNLVSDGAGSSMTCLRSSLAFCSLPSATSSPVRVRKAPRMFPHPVLPTAACAFLTCAAFLAASAGLAQSHASKYLQLFAISVITLILSPLSVSSYSSVRVRNKICGAARILKCASHSQWLPGDCLMAFTASARQCAMSLPSRFSCVLAGHCNLAYAGSSVRASVWIVVCSASAWAWASICVLQLSPSRALLHQEPYLS